MREFWKSGEGLLSEYSARKLRVLSLLVMTGFAAAVAYHYWMGAYRGLPYPWSTYFYRANDRFDLAYPQLGTHIFTDFYTAWTHTHDPSPYLGSSIFFSSNYFPFTHLLLAPFAWFSYTVALKIYLLVFAAAAVVFVLWFLRTGDPVEDAKNAVAVALMSYPVQFVLDRGNTEGLVFVLLALFIGFLIRKRPHVAAFFLACAGAMKAYPLLLGALFFRTRYGSKAAAVVTPLWVVALTIISLMTFAGGFRENVHGVIDAMSVYGSRASTGTHALQHGSSLFGAVSIMTIFSRDVPWHLAIEFAFLRSYTFYAAGFFAVVLLLVWFGPLQFWEKTAFLVFTLILLPKVSYDYKLVHVLLPLALFIRAPEKERYDWTILVMFALLLVPKNIPLRVADLTWGVVINPALMLGIMIVCLLKYAGRPGLAEPAA